MPDICKCLSSLNVRKASGLDEISQRLLRDCASGLAESLCHVFNLSLRTGVFPRLWKSAVVQPVPKPKSDRSSPKGYQPITLLSCVAKTTGGMCPQTASRFLCLQQLDSGSVVWVFAEAINCMAVAVCCGATSFRKRPMCSCRIPRCGKSI